MKTHAPSSSRWLPLAKTGMAIAALCVAGHVLAHGDDDHGTPAKGAKSASQADATKPSGDGANRPRHTHKHGEVSRGPVKPKEYPSNPLPPVPTPSAKR